MASLHRRKLKRSIPTTIMEEDSSVVGQAKTRCRLQALNGQEQDVQTGSLDHCNKNRTPAVDNLSGESGQMKKVDVGGGSDRITSRFGVEFTAAEICRLYLHHPAVRLLVDRMKDEDNGSAWEDRGTFPEQIEQIVNGSKPLIPYSEKEEEVTHPEDISDEVHSFIVDVFLRNSRPEHLFEAMMAYHPRYLDCFLKTQQFLLQEDGPLPFHYRHYIAIMASSQHQCSYLVRIHSREFLLHGGDDSWLKGVKCAPLKLQKLVEINRILAHQPWRITRDHIKQLQKGADSLSMSEVMQAVVLLTHFHSLCSFVFGSGVNSEADHLTRPGYRGSHSAIRDVRSEDCIHTNGNIVSAAQPSNHATNRVEVLVERMTRLTQQLLTEEELRERFEKIEIQNAELSSETVIKSSLSSQEDTRRFIDDPGFAYEDFSSCKRACGVSTFRAQDYSWDDHGYSLSSRLYLDVGDILDEKFSVAQNLTYYTMGDHAEIDTSSFRQAIWNYIHSLYGIRHDDYDYSVVDQLLERNLKSYIKMVTCYPERVTCLDSDRFMAGFKHSEKVHMNLMILEARLQAVLLYGLRAISRYMV